MRKLLIFAVLPALAAANGLRVGAACVLSDTAALATACTCGTGQENACIAGKFCRNDDTQTPQCADSDKATADAKKAMDARKAAEAAAAKAAADAKSAAATQALIDNASCNKHDWQAVGSTKPGCKCGKAVDACAATSFCWHDGTCNVAARPAPTATTACAHGDWSKIEESTCVCGASEGKGTKGVDCAVDKYCYGDVTTCATVARPKSWNADGSGNGLLIASGPASQVGGPSAKANVAKRNSIATAKKIDVNSKEGVDFYKHTVVKGETLHGIAASYFCGYGQLWDHLFSLNAHAATDAIGKTEAAGGIKWAAVTDADKIFVGQFIAVPIMADTKIPKTVDGKIVPGECPVAKAAVTTPAKPGPAILVRVHQWPGTKSVCSGWAGKEVTTGILSSGHQNTISMKEPVKGVTAMAEGGYLTLGSDCTVYYIMEVDCFKSQDGCTRFEVFYTTDGKQHNTNYPYLNMKIPPHDETAPFGHIVDAGTTVNFFSKKQWDELK